MDELVGRLVAKVGVDHGTAEKAPFNGWRYSLCPSPVSFAGSSAARLKMDRFRMH